MLCGESASLSECRRVLSGVQVPFCVICAICVRLVQGGIGEELGWALGAGGDLFCDWWASCRLLTPTAGFRRSTRLSFRNRVNNQSRHLSPFGRARLPPSRTPASARLGGRGSRRAGRQCSVFSDQCSVIAKSPEVTSIGSAGASPSRGNVFRLSRSFALPRYPPSRAIPGALRQRRLR